MAFKVRNCTDCGAEYSPSGPAARYCSECAEQRRRDSVRKQILKRTKMPGVGKGGHPHRGEAHWNFRHGRWTYETVRREIKQEVGCCQRCDVGLRDAGHYEWVIHHRDHNPYNWHRDNLELLCKRCHQIEHECWKAFEGATTIPQGSTAKRPEAPDPSDG